MFDSRHRNSSVLGENQMTAYLKELGKAVVLHGFNVIPIQPGQKFPSVKNWLDQNHTVKDVERWASNGRASHGVGIPTQFTPFLDVDVVDAEMLREIQEFAELNLGFAPIRIGNAPKFGMLYRTEKPFRKITSRAYVDDKGFKAQVEFMG